MYRGDNNIYLLYFYCIIIYEINYTRWNIMKVLKESNNLRDFDWTHKELYAVIKDDGNYAGVPCRSYEEAQDLSYHPGSKIYKLTLVSDPTEASFEEDLASDIRKGRLNKAYQDEHGANFDAEDENHYIQFQDHEMHTHEVNTAKDRWGNTYMTGFKNKHPRVASQSWGRAWDKRTGEVTQFSGPKYKVRADMAKYLDSKNSVTESIDDTEQVIIGFDGNGGRKYYNKDTQEWKDTAKEATVFKGVDEARNVWFGLDKKPFKRVFVVNNDENI